MMFEYVKLRLKLKNITEHYKHLLQDNMKKEVLIHGFKKTILRLDKQLEDMRENKLKDICANIFFEGEK